MTHSLLLQSIFSFCYIFLYIYILKGQCHEIFDLYFLCFKHVICAKIISRTLYFLLRNQLQSSKYGGPLCDAIFRIVKILSGICKHSQVLFCLTVSLKSVRGLQNLMWMFVQSLFCLRSEGLHINTVSTQSTATLALCQCVVNSYIMDYCTSMWRDKYSNYMFFFKSKIVVNDRHTFPQYLHKIEEFLKLFLPDQMGIRQSCLIKRGRKSRDNVPLSSGLHNIVYIYIGQLCFTTKILHFAKNNLRAGFLKISSSYFLLLGISVIMSISQIFFLPSFHYLLDSD